MEIKKPIIRPTLVDMNELIPLWAEAWEQGMITTSKFTRKFEEAMENRLGVEYAIAVNSCTSGLILGIKALGLTGEVIVPAFTFAATAHALVWNNITPVFADADPQTFNMDPDAAEAAITENTSAIMPVYTFGVPPEIDRYKEICDKHGLKLLFDSAQGLGATYKGRQAGSAGEVEVFSFSPTKVVTAVEGGVITTNDYDLAERLNRLRDYGKAPDGEDMAEIGLSARMSELHAAVGLQNIRKLDNLMLSRKGLMDRYRDALKDLPGVSFQTWPEDRTTSCNYFVIRIDEQQSKLSRDKVYEGLKQQGIQTKRYFYPALHNQTAYAPYRDKSPGPLNVAERLASQCLALPLYSHMHPDDIAEVSDEVVNLLSDK